MSYTQYIGRQIDVLAYRGADTTGPGDVLLTMAIANEVDGGQITTGIQKLAQDFLIELFTMTGTVACEPTRGCSFMYDAVRGVWRTTTDVFASFAAALIDIENTFAAVELANAELQDDEKYASAEMTAVTLTPTEASVTIKLTSQAGNSRQIIAPLATFS